MGSAESLYPDEKLSLIVRLLEEAQVPYAVGEAIALFYWGEPRATADIDINVFLSRDEAGRALVVLEDAGIVTDGDRARRDVATTAQTRVDFAGTPVDLFFADVPFHESCRERAVRVPFGQTTMNILAAEDLVVCKARFDRAKDWLDIEQVLHTRGEKSDVSYARGWIVEMVGPDDERAMRFDELASKAGG